MYCVMNRDDGFSHQNVNILTVMDSVCDKVDTQQLPHGSFLLQRKGLESDLRRSTVYTFERHFVLGYKIFLTNGFCSSVIKKSTIVIR